MHAPEEQALKKSSESDKYVETVVKTAWYL